MEIMQFAIGMEMDSEKYYRVQAQKNKDNALSVVFLALAADENRHMELLQRMAEDVPLELESENDLQQQNDLFRLAADYQSSVPEDPAQAEVYRAAMEMEQKSVNLYTDLAQKATDTVSGGVFTFLIREEKRHYTILEELYRHVNRPNGWVEAAEFGVREEY